MRQRLPDTLSERIGDRPLIVFDGECVLCSTSARFVLRHDRDRLFRLTTAQGEIGQAVYRAFGLSTENLGTMLLVEAGEVATESDAVLLIGSRLGQPWRALAAIGRLVPAAIRDPAYRLVARNRYRWFGRRATCWTPTSDERGRVL